MKYFSDDPVVEPDSAAPQPAEPQPVTHNCPTCGTKVGADWREVTETPPTARPPQVDITVEATPGDQITPGDPAHRRARAAAGRGAATWLGLYRQPPSVSDAWQLSSIIDRNRIPGESGVLATFWWLWNRTARIALFAAIIVLLAAVSTMLWCACRPTRAIGLLIVLLLVFGVIPAMAGG